MVDLFMAMKSVMAMQEKEMKLLTSNQPMVQGKNMGRIWFRLNLGLARIGELFGFRFIVIFQMKPNYLSPFVRHLVMKMQRNLSWFGFMVVDGQWVVPKCMMGLF